jgi:hypothetical protein
MVITISEAASTLVAPLGGFIEGVERLIQNDPPVLKVGLLEQLGRLKEESDCPDSEIIAMARTCSSELASGSTAREVEALIKLVRRSLKIERAEAW